MLEFGRGVSRERNCGLRLVGFGFRAQLLARARDGESLIVEQLLDAQHAFDVALAVHALSRAAFDWLQLRELRLPEAKDIRGQVAKRGHFADPEIKFVRDEDLIRFVLPRTFFSRCHFPRHPRQKPRGLPIVTQVPCGIEEFRNAIQGQVSLAAPKVFSCAPPSGFIGIDATLPARMFAVPTNPALH